jgi:hypothetical protein
LSRISVSYVVDLKGCATDPDVITDKTGVAATWMIREGQPSPFSARTKSRTTSWILEVVQDGYEVEPVLAALLAQLATATSTFADIARDFRSYVSIWLVPDGGYPSVGISAPMLAEIAALGASIDIDIQESAPHENEAEPSS